MRTRDKKTWIGLAIGLIGLGGLGGLAGAELPKKTDAPGAAELNRMTARFARVELKADTSQLPQGDRRALAKLVQAGQVFDGIFLRQAWAGNAALLPLLSQDTTPLGKARLHAFLVNKGLWSELDQHAPFLPGVGARPPGGNLYPADATREEVARWLKSLPEAQRAQAAGFFTTIRRGPDGKLTAVPYSVEYQGELMQAAALLREAAALTTQPRLRSFLTKRAAAFLSNDYHESDVAWMELDGSIEPTIGPYEVYVDDWFNAKASFEAYITLRDEEETKRLQRLGGYLQEIEDNLPIDARLRNPRLGALAPIRVVNSIFSGGDGNRGVQSAAYNLPNDERTVRDKGSKRVMLKNVQEAKFKTVLLPIARQALPRDEQRRVAFDVFFTHILMHELVHGLGPHNINVGGKATTVRQQLQDLYSPIEEAKADIAGLFAMHHLIDKGALPKAMEQTMYTTFLASAFRTIRFGVKEAHGKGMALQLNYLLDAGAYKVNRDGTFSVDEGKIRAAVKGLTAELMTVQGTGDLNRANDLLQRLGGVRPEVQRVLDRLKDVPVDIEPRYTTAERLLAEEQGAAAATLAEKE